MHIEAHKQKISRLERSRAQLDPTDDFELWFWATMMAGTHALNAALHHARLTPDDDAYPAQPGVYQVPRPDGTLTAVLRTAGDVLHVGRPRIEATLPPDVQRIADAMETIEAYRDPCVRDGRPPAPETVQVCDAALRDCLSLLRQRLALE